MGGAGTANATDAMPFYLDDALPWFDGSGFTSNYPHGQDDVVLQMNADGAPARATLTTYLPTDLLSYAHTLDFSARASRPAPLLVSVGHELQRYDYFAREPAETWPLARVDLGEEWQTFSIALADFEPSESARQRAHPSFFVSFIVESPAPLELWFDQVALK